MRLTPRLGVIVSAITLCSASAARAQHQNTVVELGIDAVFARQSFHTEPDINGREITTTVNTIDLPLGVIRAGFFITESVAIEPAFGLRYQRVGDGSNSQTVFDVGVPIYLSPNRHENQVYVRPVVGLTHLSSEPAGPGPGSSNTQVNLGVGLGIKMPLSDRFAARFEAQYRHGWESDHVSAYNEIAALAGISVYVR